MTTTQTKANLAPESGRVEWKQSLGEWKETVETCAAFATAGGGTIVACAAFRGIARSYGYELRHAP